MIARPGGALKTRPLHFIWIADCSGSMSINGKIVQLNQAVRESLPHMQQVARSNPYANVLVRCLKFSNGADWHIREPQPLERFHWADLDADPLEYKPVQTDLIFLMDTSGSMGQEIKAVRTSCIDFANQISEQGADVRLGLVGFAIGGASRKPQGYQVINLSKYTIGIWPLAAPEEFQTNVRSLKLRSLGGSGCYLADADTLDIFPHVLASFGDYAERKKILVVVSDEIGGIECLEEVTGMLNKAGITAHVLGVPGQSGAHEEIARLTGGQFWNISEMRTRYDFNSLLSEVAKTIAREVTHLREDGTRGTGTDMGMAMRELAKALRVPPMEQRAFPPVLVLISDGQPKDDFAGGLVGLESTPWGRKSVRIAIAIGEDADLQILKQFMSNTEMPPLEAHNSEALARHIQWVSTTVLKAASSPASQPVKSEYYPGYVPIPRPAKDADVSVWEW